MAVYVIPKTRSYSRVNQQTTTTNALAANNNRPPYWWMITTRFITTRKPGSTTNIGVRIDPTTQINHAITKSLRTSAITRATGPSIGDRTTGRQQKKGKFIKKFQFLIPNAWQWKAGVGWTILSVLDWWLLAVSGWITWRGVLLKWTPIGLCLAAAVQWHLFNRYLERINDQPLPRTAKAWQANVYCSLPLRLMSRGWGYLASCYIPPPIRPFVYGAYSTTYGVNMDEAAVSDLRNYRSLAEFFTRPLKDNVRCIDNSCLVSPADGRVLHFGLADNEQIEQVKGVTYNIDSFLGPNDWVQMDNKQQCSTYIDSIRRCPKEDSQFYQCIIYLAPGDYHRFHSPTTWIPERRRHFSGELLSVSPNIAKWLPGLFCLNERVTYIGQWEHGFFSFTAVGATNVGSVQIYIDEKLKTNKWHGFRIKKYSSQEYDELVLDRQVELSKGELLGQFNMGSTVVLVFEAPKNFKFDIQPGQTIKMGEKLGCVNESK